jgi:hypothetical protein
MFIALCHVAALFEYLWLLVEQMWKWGKCNTVEKWNPIRFHLKLCRAGTWEEILWDPWRGVFYAYYSRLCLLTWGDCCEKKNCRKFIMRRQDLYGNLRRRKPTHVRWKKFFHYDWNFRTINHQLFLQKPLTQFSSWFRSSSFVVEFDFVLFLYHL